MFWHELENTGTHFPDCYKNNPTERITLSTEIIPQNHRDSASLSHVFVQEGSNSDNNYFYLRIGIKHPEKNFIYPLGCMQYEIFPEIHQFIIRDLQNESEKSGYLCRHVGAALLELALRKNIELGGNYRIRLMSYSNAVLFYHQWGFMPENEILLPEISYHLVVAKEQKRRIEFTQSLWMTLPESAVIAKKIAFNIPSESDCVGLGKITDQAENNMSPSEAITSESGHIEFEKPHYYLNRGFFSPKKIGTTAVTAAAFGVVAAGVYFFRNDYS